MYKLFISSALLVSTTVMANEEGKELHDESCLACHVVEHDDAFYQREVSRLHNFGELRRQVSMCMTNFSVDWFPEEEKSVVDFLNTYYKFKP